MRSLAAASLVTSILAVGCGSETVDEADLEGQLKSQLGQNAGVEPRSVDCPSDIAAERGTEFECTLVAPNGDEVPVEGTITNDEGGFEAEVVSER